MASDKLYRYEVLRKILRNDVVYLPKGSDPAGQGNLQLGRDPFPVDVSGVIELTEKEAAALGGAVRRLGPKAVEESDAPPSGETESPTAPEGDETEGATGEGDQSEEAPGERDQSSQAAENPD